MKRPLFSRLAMAITLMVSTGAFAHDDATLDKVKTPHGGQLRMAGIYHFELVVAKDSKNAKDNPVAVYLTDHGGNKIPVAGAMGKATILAGKSKITIPLAPTGDNKLEGVGKYASDPQMKAIVSVTLADKKTSQARFTPLAARMADGHTDHHH